MRHLGLFLFLTSNRILILLATSTTATSVSSNQVTLFLLFHDVPDKNQSKEERLMNARFIDCTRLSTIDEWQSMKPPVIGLPISYTGLTEVRLFFSQVFLFFLEKKTFFFLSLFKTSKIRMDIKLVLFFDFKFLFPNLSTLPGRHLLAPPPTLHSTCGSSPSHLRGRSSLFGGAKRACRLGWPIMDVSNPRAKILFKVGAYVIGVQEEEEEDEGAKPS